MRTLFEEKSLAKKEFKLTDFFKSGFKNTQKIGVEYEKIPVSAKNFTAPDFFFKNGILDFLSEYQKKFNLIPCFENEILLSLISNRGTITLEPGCQVELSLHPTEKISDIEREIDLYNKNCNKITEVLGIRFLALGLQPVSTFRNIKIIPKERYKFMTKYLKDQATLPFVMMRETAGIQTSIDYSSEEDAIKKLSTALKLSPFLNAFFCNSPIRNGKLSGYKSFRSYAWLNTDNKRCGLISKKLFDKNTDFSFNDYVEILLDVPMIFNSGKYVANTTFREYMNNTKTVDEDIWKNHLSLFFPDVRLKNYIEIRNHDCQKKEYALAIPALYKGIMYSKNGIEKINELLKDFKYFDYEFIRQNSPRFGMNFEVQNKKIPDIIKEIFIIAYEGLKEFKSDEEKYLEPSIDLLKEKNTPADILIKNFENCWSGNIEKLIEYSQI